MKSTSKSNLFLRQSLLAVAALALGASVAHADTVTANATVRVLNGTPDAFGDLGALSLYSDGGGNIQRSFLNFDLSAYSGKALTTDVTMTLTAGIYGDSLNNVQLGTTNAAWSTGTITWNNQPSLTTVSGVTNPSGTFGSGPVTWTIPWYIVEKWATAGYNGIGLTSGSGSTQHFYSLSAVDSANFPKLTFTSTDGADGTWTGGDGTWTDSANWASSTVAQGINKTATINDGTTVNITMDANRSVGALSFSGANHTIAAGAGKLALVTSTGIPSITVASSTTSTIAAQIVGVDGLEKLGTGTLTLSGANTYSGTTTISAGTLSLAAAGALPAGGGVAIGAGGKLSNDEPAGTSFALHGLTLNGGELAATNTPDFSLGNFYLQGNVTVGGSASSTILADLRVVSNQTRDFNVSATGDSSGVDLLISGKLGHQNNVAWGYATKSGAGVMKLSGVNELGGMTVNAGRFILEDNAIGWAYPVQGLVNNSQLEFSVTSGSRSYGATLGGTGALFKTGAGTMTLTASNTYAGTTTVSGGTLVLQGSGGGGTDYNGGNININGASTLRVSGERYNFSGKTFTFDSTGGGTIDAIASGAGGMVFMGNNTFATSGGAQNIISGTRNGGENQGFNLNGATATFNVATGDHATSDLKVTGTLWNGGNVIKDGAGRMEFSATQQYSGTTTVNQGKLVMGDAAADTFATSGVTVASGAALGGSGTISGTVAATGILAPGNAGVSGGIGTLAAGTTTWNGGDGSANLWQFDLSASSSASDKLNITGDFVKGGSGTYKFDFMGSTPTWNTTYTLVTWSGSLSGFNLDVSDFSFTNLGAGSYSTSHFTITGSQLNFTAVPEPTSALAGLLLGAGLLRRRRRA